MILTEKELKEKYNSLVKDADFDKLLLELQKPNIFEILNISSAEIRHSNFLAWLLDPKSSHSLGDIFLKRFLREIFSNDVISELDQFMLETLDLNSIVIRREWRNIDLLLFTNEFVLCIENKVFSKDSNGQLKKYRKIIEDYYPDHKKVFVYLTPFGELSREEQDVFVPLSYDAIIEILDRVLSVYEDTLNDSVSNYLKDYKIILNRYIMKNDPLSELAKKIYNNHTDILEFIFDKRPDIAEDFKVFFVEKVKESGWILGSPNKGFVRFLTPAIKDLVPQYVKSNGWPNREGFLFEIDFYWSNQKKVVFKAIISPGNEKYANTLSDILSQVDGSISAAGKKYIVHFIESASFDLEKLKDKTDIEIKEVIDKFWPKITDIVNKVETAMIENKDQILNSLDD